MANKQVANLNKEGILSLNGIIDENSVPKVGNLIHHIPFDNKDGIDSAKYIPSVNFLSTGVEDKIQDSHNLLDSIGFDWRNPSNWEGVGSNVKYNEEYDCLEVTGARSIYGLGSVPIIHNKKFNISCDVWQVSRSSGTRIYIGGKYYGENGTVRPNSEHIPGSWDYTSFGGNQLQPNDGWVTGHNKYIGGVPRQGIGTSNSQWKNNNGKFYQPLILANYSGTATDVVRIRNLRIWYSDDKIDNNTTHTGLSTQTFNNTKTNLYTGLTSTYGFRDGLSGLSCKTHEITMPNGERGIRVVTQGNANGGVNINTSVGTMVVKPNTKYTLSCMIRVNDPNLAMYNSNVFYTREYNAAGTLVKSTGIFPKNDYINAPHVGDGWKYISLTFQTQAEVVSLRLDQYVYRLGATLEFGNITLVEGRGSFYIPYGKTVNKSKSLEIPTRDLTSFTVLLTFINNQHLIDKETGGLQSGANLLTLKSNNGNLNFKLWINSNKDYYPYLNPSSNSDWNETSSNRNRGAYNMGIKVGGIYTIAIQYNSVSKESSWFMLDNKGNNIGGDKIVATANTPILKSIMLGDDSSVWDAQYIDLKVYNSVLDESKVKYTSLSKVNVDDGKLSENISEILDRPKLPLLNIPKRKNEYGEGYQTSTSYNNLAKSDTSQWSSPNRPNIDRTVITPYGKGIKFMSGSISGVSSGRNSTAYMYDDVSGFTTSDYVCYSAWVYMSKDCDITTARISLEKAKSESVWYDMSKKGQWQFLQIRGKITDGTRPLRHLLYLLNSKETADFKGYVIYSDITLTKTTNGQGASPTSQFENLPVNDRSLKFNLKNTINFNWSSNWTIQYWKKPMGSDATNYRGYCLDSIGRNSNTVGGSYLWWGKPNASDSISDAGSFDPNQFWNHWRLITLVHDASSNNITVYEENRFKKHKRIVAISITKDNQYLTQNGYDLFLGGWNDTKVCIAEYKDIRVGQWALSETEVNNCFKQGMSQNDVLTLNGELIENTL